MYSNAAQNLLAANHHILTEPTPCMVNHHLTDLELWLKYSQAIVTGSKTDATAKLHRTQHERGARLTHFFRYRRLKKTPEPLENPAPVCLTSLTHNNCLNIVLCQA
jgi:hypothetical protein